MGLCSALEEPEILPVEEMLALFGLESRAGRRVRHDQRLLERLHSIVAVVQGPLVVEAVQGGHR